MSAPFYIALLHDEMVDKHNKLVTTSITLIDLHDIARSARTFGAKKVFVAHSSPTMRKLARTVKGHWEHGFGATYNPNRKEALENLEVVSDLDAAVSLIEEQEKALPILVATSAKAGGTRCTFQAFKSQLETERRPILLMFGTGWGMSEDLIARTELFLAPINGPTEYNHLSVRSACAIMLDRLFGS